MQRLLDTNPEINQSDSQDSRVAPRLDRKKVSFSPKYLKLSHTDNGKTRNVMHLTVPIGLEAYLSHSYLSAYLLIICVSHIFLSVSWDLLGFFFMLQ